MVTSPKSPAQNWSPRHCRDLRWHPTARPRHSKPQATPQSDLRRVRWVQVSRCSSRWELEQVVDVFGVPWFLYRRSFRLSNLETWNSQATLQQEMLNQTHKSLYVSIGHLESALINYIQQPERHLRVFKAAVVCLMTCMIHPKKRLDRSWLNPTRTLMMCVSISFLGVAICVYIYILYIYIIYIYIGVFCDCPQPSRHWTLPLGTLGCPHACHSAWQMPDKTAVKQRWRKVPPVSVVFNCWALLSIEDLNFHELFDFCHVVRKVLVASWLPI